MAEVTASSEGLPMERDDVEECPSSDLEHPRPMNDPEKEIRLRRFLCAETDQKAGISIRRHFENGSPSAFQHEPLADPGKQIRLLKFLSFEYGDDIALEMRPYDIKDPPKYLAISYTWGDEDSCYIKVNGKRLHVRQNSRYALWQAWLHHPSDYIWIDSICIDQSNERHEKGHQVKLMGQIYEKASGVLACVGSSADDSDWIMDLINGMYPEKCENDFRVDGVIVPYRHRYGPAFFNGMEAFFGRTYWSRLWILQEVAAGVNSGVDILCGARFCEKDDLDSFCSADFAWATGTSYVDVRNVELGTLSLHAGLQKYGAFECTDRRDRLYALRPLLKPDDFGRQILPDYNMPVEELARELCLIGELGDIEPVLTALEIDGHHPQMREWVEQRQSRESARSRSATPNAPRSWHRLVNRHIIELLPGPDDGSLTIDQSYSGRESPIDDLLASESLAGERAFQTIITTVTIPPQTLGLACHGARAGNVFVPVMSLSNILDFGLVLRRICGSEYDVVGQAILHNNLWSIPFVRGDVRLRLCIEDAMVLMGQDLLLHGRRYKWPPRPEDVALHVERLFTNPVLSPPGAATVEFLE